MLSFHPCYPFHTVFPSARRLYLPLCLFRESSFVRGINFVYFYCTIDEIWNSKVFSLFITPFARAILYDAIGMGCSVVEVWGVAGRVVRFTYFLPSVIIPFLCCNELSSWCPAALQVSHVSILLSSQFWCHTARVPREEGPALISCLITWSE